MDQNQNNSTVKDNKHSLVCKRESLQLNLEKGNRHILANSNNKESFSTNQSTVLKCEHFNFTHSKESPEFL